MARHYRRPHPPSRRIPFSHPIAPLVSEPKKQILYKRNPNPITPVTAHIREFIRPFHNDRTIYGLYGMFDSTNLYYSLCSLYFAFKDAYNNTSNLLNTQDFLISNKEFHDAESTPDGFFYTVIFGLILVSYASLGSFSDSEKSNYFILRMLAFTWPYIRDVFKVLKWFFKGLRSTLAILAQFTEHKDLLIHLLFPLAIIFGTLAMANRVFLRSMRDGRKKMMKEYDQVSKKALELRTPFHHLKQAPENYLAYTNALVFLDCNGFGESKQLFYINDKGVAQPLNIDLNSFADKIEVLETQNIHYRMKHYLQSLIRTMADNNTQNGLHFYSGEYSEEALKSKGYTTGSYVYLSASNIENDRRLCRINEEGNLVFDETHSAAFHRQYLAVLNQKQTRHLSVDQLSSINEIKPFLHPGTSDNPLPPVQLGSSYTAFLEFRNSKKIEDQSQFLNTVARVSAAFSGIFDGLYFYMGTMSLALFSPLTYNILLISSIILFIVCVLTRINEENEYQRKLTLTTLRAELDLSKTAAMILSEQFECLSSDTHDWNDPNLNELVESLKQSWKKRYTKAFAPADDNASRSSILQELLLDELECEVNHCKTTQKELQKNSESSETSAFLAGLMNGLGVQGVIASFMFMTSTLYLGSTAACLPTFTLLCLSTGMIAIIVCSIQAVVAYRAYKKTADRNALALNTEYSLELEYFKDGVTNNQRDMVAMRQTIAYINQKELDPPPEYMVIEWCEIFRLFYSGLVKGDKATIELFYKFLKRHDDLWIMPFITAVSAILFGAVLALRYIAKTFLDIKDNEIETTPVKTRDYDDTTTPGNEPLHIQTNNDQRLPYNVKELPYNVSASTLDFWRITSPSRHNEPLSAQSGSFSPTPANFRS